MRVTAEALWTIENNLAIANAGGGDFADQVESDGVIRGPV